MEVRANFYNNCNVMLLVVVAEFLIAIILYFLSSRINNSLRVHKVCQHLLKELFVTLVLFNCLNFSFSMGVYFGLGELSAINIILLTITIALFFYCIISIQASKPKGYGEFK